MAYEWGHHSKCGFWALLQVLTFLHNFVQAQSLKVKGFSYRSPLPPECFVLPLSYHSSQSGITFNSWISSHVKCIICEFENYVWHIFTVGYSLTEEHVGWHVGSAQYFLSEWMTNSQSATLYISKEPLARFSLKERINWRTHSGMSIYH